MFNYKWYLKNGYPDKEVTKHNHNVFTTFACGGGSSMGYKLAGYNVLAANDIDPQMAKVYKENHHPKHFFQCGIEELLNQELPEELYNIDILDGSPPCSTFSIAGSREKKWGTKHKFREGQATQVLDDLFFQFIKLVYKVKPKIVVAENVKGMLQGNAKGYVLEIKQQLNNIGYDVQIFLLNAATMGVPQKRERVFFIARKKELNLQDIKLSFNEKPVLFKEIEEKNNVLDNLTEASRKLWKKCKPGQSFSTVHFKGSWFNSCKTSPQKVLNTITANQAISGGQQYHYKIPRILTNLEYTLGGSFPLDYNFMDVKPKYLIGMSIPPVMMAQVSYQIYKQWLGDNSE